MVTLEIGQGFDDPYLVCQLLSGKTTRAGRHERYQKGKSRTALGFALEIFAASAIEYIDTSSHP